MDDGDVGFLRRVAPAILVAIAGGALLYALPSPSGTEAGDETPTATGTPTAGPSAGTANGATTSAARTVPGDAITFKFGVVQTDVVLTGPTITDIVTVKAPGGGYQSYTDRAVPVMKQRIIEAQSTAVATVSGATYTSKAYAESVQSALDKA